MSQGFPTRQPTCKHKTHNRDFQIKIGTNVLDACGKFGSGISQWKINMLWYREVRLEQSQPLGSMKSIILSNSCLTIYLSNPHSSPHLVTAWLSSKQTTGATIWKQTEAALPHHHQAHCSLLQLFHQNAGAGTRVSQHKPKVGLSTEQQYQLPCRWGSKVWWAQSKHC